MQKKHFILSGIAVVLVASLAYFILYQPKGKAYDDIDTIMGVPVNSELIVHIPNLEKLVTKTTEKGTWEALNKWYALKKLDTLSKDCSKALTPKEIRELLDNAQLTIATKIVGRNSIEFSYIFPMKATHKKIYIEKLLRYFFKEFTTSSKKYSGFDLYHVTASDSKTHFFYAFAKGLFILSTSQISLEDALLQIHNQNSLLTKQSFQKLRRIASENDDVNIFINGEKFPKLLALKTNEKYSQFITELTDFTTQIGLDVSINKDNILLNGFLYTNTDDFFYTNILLNQEPVKFTIEDIIPANTRFWAALSLSNESAYLDNYKRYLEQTGDIKDFRSFSGSFKKQTNLFPENFIYPLLDSEIGLVISEDKILGESTNKYSILRTKSKSETEKALISLLENYNKKSKQNYQSSSYRVDEKLSYTLYPFPFPEFAHMMWGGLFYEAPTNYCTLLDNYLIWGSSKESLQRYIDYIVRRKTLKYDIFYQSQKKYWVDNESSFVAYFHTGDGYFLKKYASEEVQKVITEKAAILEKFPSASIQVKTLKDMLYVNGYISYSHTTKQAPKTVWQSRLDNPLRMKPVMVSNHNNKKQELIFQDNQNILYLVSNAGRILWKLPLNESIIGTIHQVDYYKNNKLQYLFNTRNKLYLIDRNGNNVSNFPIGFRSPATNGIAVFDYDDDKNYRIFVTTKNKQTYLYNISGKLIKGWEAAKNEHEVHETVQYFVEDGKDYIVYNDGYRNYILSRRGKVRVLPKQNFKKAERSQICIISSTSKQKCSLVATDTTGLIYFTNLDGSVKTQRVGKFSKKHFFESYDLNVDGKNDFIFIDQNKLFVFDASGKEMFTYSFDKSIANTPNLYSFSAKDRKIGICVDNKIYLFNSDGKLYEGFPLEGYSNFTIGFTSEKDRQFNLFVAGSNDLLFNYAVP